MSTVRFDPGKREDAPKVPKGRIPLGDPLIAPRPIPRTKMQIILPAVLGVAFLGMIALIVSQPGLRTGTVGIFSLFFPVMMLMSFGGMFMMNRGGGGDKQLSPAQMEEARREQLRELDSKREEVHDVARAQFAQFQFLHPEPSLLGGLVGSPRMWERSTAHPHFGFVRLGVGASKLAMEFETPLLGRPEDYEPITFDAMRAFLLEQGSVRGIAKPQSFSAVPGLGLVGGKAGMEPVYAVARAMICQAAVFHSPVDLKVMVLTDDVSRWEWCKWLPHCQHPTLVDSGGAARMVWGSPEEMNAAVGAELHDRKGFGEVAGTTPHWLVFNDQARVDAEWETLTRKAGVAGVTFVRLAAEKGSGVGFADATTLFITEDEGLS